MIQVDALTVAYGEVTALRGVAVSVEPGEIVALRGPSGCGKSTLLRAIAGLIRPQGGRIALQGLPVTGHHVWRPPYERRVGFVFQELALWPHLRAWRHVDYPLRGITRNAAERRTKAEALLAEYQLTGREQAFPHQLSGGQRQRLAWTRAIAANPPILLLDEAFAFQDAGNAQHLAASLRARAAEGAAVLLASHQEPLADTLAHRTIHLREGEIVAA